MLDSTPVDSGNGFRRMDAGFILQLESRIPMAIIPDSSRKHFPDFKCFIDQAKEWNCHDQSIMGDL